MTAERSFHPPKAADVTAERMLEQRAVVREAEVSVANEAIGKVTREVIAIKTEIVAATTADLPDRMETRDGQRDLQAESATMVGMKTEAWKERACKMKLTQVVRRKTRKAQPRKRKLQSLQRRRTAIKIQRNWKARRQILMMARTL